MTDEAKTPKAKPANAVEQPEAKDAKGESGAAVKNKMLKAVGNDATVLAFNPETNTLVTEQGGKYRMSADGKRLIHLAGPVPEAKAKADAKAAAKAEEDED